MSEQNFLPSSNNTPEEQESNSDDSTKGVKFRWTIGIKMCLGLATFVLLIFLASLLGWTSILEMNDIQKTITQQRIPELSLAIKMGQESVGLMNTAPKLLAADSQEEVTKINTLIHESSKNLTQILEQLKSTNQDGASLIVSKYKSLSLDLTNNLDLLKESVTTTLSSKASLSRLLTRALREVRNVNRDLVLEIDDQTFFLYTGWKNLDQVKAAPLARRARKSSLNDYRSLLLLKAQIQLASNLLNEAVQESNPDLIQPLRERFRATLGNCKQVLQLVSNQRFKDNTFRRLEILEQVGLSEYSTHGKKDIGLFLLQEKILKEKQLQNGYLSINQNVVQSLSSQTEQMIRDIQDAGAKTTQIFERTVSEKTNQLGLLNLITIVLAFCIGFFLVGKHFIGRLRRLSQTMLTMSKGNLEIPLSLEGDDEITDMGRAMEVFRRYAIEAQELNLVQTLAQEVQEKNSKLEGAIGKLQRAQQRIIMQEKLASLGQLTSGIAHEIKNPLNFINNFSLLSQELLEDLSRELIEPENKLSDDSRGFIEDTLKDLHGNMNKIHTHGQRANDIIKGMLQHSRDQAEDAKEVINFNRFVDSSVNLAFQGKRSSDSGFNVDFKKEYSDTIDEVEINPQDISRVVLNLVTNACDAVEEKSKMLSKDGDKEYSPCIWVKTNKNENNLEVRVADNGPGISEEMAKKIFDPSNDIFTTKPTDKGTGLGLSLSHDIVLKHGGSLEMTRSQEGGAEFIVQLPLIMAEQGKKIDDAQTTSETSSGQNH